MRIGPWVRVIVCPLIVGAKVTLSSPPGFVITHPPASASLVTAVIASRSEQFGGVNAFSSEFVVTTVALPLALALAARTSDATTAVNPATSTLALIRRLPFQ